MRYSVVLKPRAIKDLAHLPLTLHPNVLERDGKKAFVVLPYEEFVRIEEELDSFDDLLALREAKADEANAVTVDLSAVRKELKI